MKVSFSASALAVVAAGFFILAAACQQANKGESKSKWQLQSPPGPAAGYGSIPLEPLDTDTPKKPSAPQTKDNSHVEATPATNEAASRQPETENGGPSPAIPALKIQSPPSAAGYGSPFPNTGERKETPTVAPANGSGRGEAPPPEKESAHQQPASGGYGPSPSSSSWKIEPPPSAAGYGK